MVLLDSSAWIEVLTDCNKTSYIPCIILLTPKAPIDTVIV